MSALTCRDVADFLDDYAAHELDAAQRAVFESHLAECDACVQYIRDYELAVRLGRAAFEEADERVPRQLVAAILAARRRP